MKNTIGKKITIVIFIPFLIIFGGLMAYIASTILQYAADREELKIKGISEINAADLEGRVLAVQYSVLAAANLIENLDTTSPQARMQAEDAIKAMFMNSRIYNAWLAFEPDAFDGIDSQHKEDYPGAPSGRFIRSFVSEDNSITEDNSIIEAPDMDEETLDDPDISPWYVVPRDTGQLYVDVDNNIANLYDYGVGGEPLYTLSIVAPVIIDGSVAGCVGADMVFNDMTFGIGGDMQAAVAIFYPNSRIFYSEELKYAEESVESLNFKSTTKIKEALSNGEALFLSDEYSKFLDTQAFTYFHPTKIGDADGGFLSLYVATPRAGVFYSLRTLIILLLVILIALLMVVFAMYLYISRGVAGPLEKLTLAADLISKGKLETEIPSFSESKDEIGMLSRALFRMVEQFRVNIGSLEQTQAELTIRSQIDPILKSSQNEREMFYNICAVICRHFDVSKVTAVLERAGGASAAASFTRDGDPSENDAKKDFPFHSQVMSVLAGKRLAYFNSYGIHENNLSFMGKETRSACFVPLQGKLGGLGYIILENNDAWLMGGAEQILVYIADLIAGWLEQREEEEAAAEKTTETYGVALEGLPPELQRNPAEEIPNETSGEPSEETTKESFQEEISPIITVINEIEGTDTEAAITAMGGLRKVYEKSALLTVRLIPETLERLDRYIESDIKAFAIEIHGAKGSLNNIGAFQLGSAALSLELAAKAEDTAYCAAEYPNFKRLLLAFYEKLAAFVADKAADKPEGDLQALAEALKSSEAEAENYDCAAALKIITPFTAFTYGYSMDGALETIIHSLEEYDCEKALPDIQDLGEKINNTL